MAKYHTINELAPIWGVTPGRIRVLCQTGRIPGAKCRVIDGRAVWTIPVGTEKPEALPPGIKPRK